MADEKTAEQSEAETTRRIENILYSGPDSGSGPQIDESHPNFGRYTVIVEADPNRLIRATVYCSDQAERTPEKRHSGDGVLVGCITEIPRPDGSNDPRDEETGHPRGFAVSHVRGPVGGNDRQPEEHAALEFAKAVLAVRDRAFADGVPEMVRRQAERRAVLIDEVKEFAQRVERFNKRGF